MSESEGSNLFDFSNTSLGISGSIINALNGYPLSGLHIAGFIVIPRVRSQDRHAKNDLKHEFLIGEDISDFNGRFTLLLKTKNVIPFLPLSTQDEKLSLILRVNDNYNKPSTILEYALDAQSNFKRITLNALLPKVPISRTLWKDLATRIRRARLIQIHELVRQLSDVTPKQLLFGDLNTQTRQSIITELEKAFLDPSGILTKISEISGFHTLRDPGNLNQYLTSLRSKIQNREVREAVNQMKAKLEAFYDLFDVDWPLGLEELEAGKVGRAMQKYEQLYTVHSLLKGSHDK